jgi:hypothetical protein
MNTSSGNESNLGLPCRKNAGSLNNLDAGLYLEDRKILLPWQARIPYLMCCGQPDRQTGKQGWETFHWQRPVVMNGLRTRMLEVVLYPYGWFDSAWLWLARSPSLEKAEVAYQCALQHLTCQLGQPLEHCPPAACGADRQRTAWEQRRLRINLFIQTDGKFEPWSYICAAHIIHRAGE